jgi:hypothetical protein
MGHSLTPSVNLMPKCMPKIERENRKKKLKIKENILATRNCVFQIE